jgi:hypothetical protein
LGVQVLSRPLAIGITILVSTVWAANVVVGALYPDRHDATINAIFAIIVGAVFGLTPKRETLAAARRRLLRTSGDEPPQEPAEDTPPPAADPSRGDDS